MMDWESDGLERSAAYGEPEAAAELDAFRREMRWRVPGSVAAVIVLWELARTFARRAHPADPASLS